ncbi:uncharacterized protein LOC117583131 [Drosophila guanche]|uniref:C2H2-type domain-containing protein n=1 Tax=Drosophila guanche TaxID=7266 RepID=A0A3B0JKH2_DROGU|nr:uncharacterized protein LOC117583131 [Drosophila guanche]SPP73969.1 Hypothetical predicted protein [Drosophila guanche]
MEQKKSKPTEDGNNSDSDVEIVECCGLDKPKIGLNVMSKAAADANDSDSDVEIIGCFALSKPTIREKPPPNSPAMTHIPMPLATPPWSPTDTSMPILSTITSLRPGSVLCIPCYLCQKRFYDIDLLKEHLSQHGMEIYRSTLQPQVTTVQPTVQQFILDPIKFNFSSAQSTPPLVPSFNNSCLKRGRPRKVSFECQFCKIKLSSSQDLELHHKRCNPGKAAAANFVCKYCNKAYRREGFLTRHMRQKHNFRLFDLPKAPPSPCSSAASTSESTFTESSTELTNAEPTAVVCYPSSGEFIAPSELLNADPPSSYCPISEFTSSTSESTFTENRTELSNAEPAVDCYPSNREFMADGELVNAASPSNYCPISEFTATALELTSSPPSTRLIKDEPAIDSCEASESHEELAAKAAAFYCPPAEWAAMGRPFANGYFIPMDPNKTYPLRRDDCFLGEFSNWVSQEEMDKYSERCQT